MTWNWNKTTTVPLRAKIWNLKKNQKIQKKMDRAHPTHPPPIPTFLETNVCRIQWLTTFNNTNIIVYYPNISVQQNPCRTTTLTNDRPSYTTIFRVTDSVFCLCGPWPTTILQTRPTTGSDGILSLMNDHFEYSIFPRIARGASKSVPSEFRHLCSYSIALN